MEQSDVEEKPVQDKIDKLKQDDEALADILYVDEQFAPLLVLVSFIVLFHNCIIVFIKAQ